jgi:indole-3-acetate monooxygenase
MTTDLSAPPVGVVARARDIGPLLNQTGKAAREAGLLDPGVVSALIESDLLRMFVPRDLGGLEAPFSEGLEALEELCRADAPSGWCAMAVTGFLGSSSAYLPDAGATALYAGEEYARIAGLLAPNGRVTAERGEGGYTFSGRAQFASGSMLATHFVFAGSLVEDGSPVRDASGEQPVIIGFIPRGDVKLLGNWDVDGLEPTESVDYEVDRAFVEEQFTFPMSRLDAPPLRGTTLVVGLAVYASALHGTMALGMGTRLLEEIAVLAPSRTRPGSPSAADRELFNHQLSTCELRLTAARDLFYATVGGAEREAAETGAPAADVAGRRVGALVAHIHDVAMECADLAYSWGGSASFRGDSAIGRFYRDVNVARNHFQANRGKIAEAGPDTRARLALARGALDR